MTTERSRTQRRRSTTRALLAPVLATAGLGALLLAPFPAGMPGHLAGWPGGLFPPIDKVAHFVLFFAAAWPWHRSFVELGIRNPALAVVAGGTVYAGLLELLQGALTASRSAETGDLVAGMLGSVACALWLGWRRRAGAETAVSRPVEVRQAPARPQPPRPPG